MVRELGSLSEQENASTLKNQLCPAGSPLAMAQVSSHLRNFAVAETIGLIARLDGHPRIIHPPSVGKDPAFFQQIRGTSANPFTHAIPCNLLFEGDTILKFYRTVSARTMIERTFGMGVMAPRNWEDLGTFGTLPRELNTVDNLNERYRAGGGLVGAFIESARCAVERSIWDGSGHARHGFSSLATFVHTVYASEWIPKATAAYMQTRSYLRGKLAEPRSSYQTNKQRLEILDAQIDVFERDRNIVEEAVHNVIKATTAESWIENASQDKYVPS